MLIEAFILIENIDVDKEITLEDSILQWVFELINELSYQHSESRKIQKNLKRNRKLDSIWMFEKKNSKLEIKYRYKEKT